MIDLKGMQLIELKRLFEGYRALQIYEAVHKNGACGIDDITTLPKMMRAEMSKTYGISSLNVEKIFKSQIDGTCRYLLSTSDGEYIETVLMKHNHGHSLCISTQVGCKMGCVFCASSKVRFKRNLTAGEMLDGIYLAERDNGLRLSNVVLMGIGEPLDNYDNVVSFLKILSSKEGRNLSLRSVSLSTCGIVPMIDRLREEKLGITLSVSLHSPFDEVRSKLMPINRTYPIPMLMNALRNYVMTTGRRISLEYTVIDGVNNREEDAARLRFLTQGIICHINLININPYGGEPEFSACRHAAADFAGKLTAIGLNATVRRTTGADIAAACGQLRANSRS